MRAPLGLERYGLNSPQRATLENRCALFVTRRNDLESNANTTSHAPSDYKLLVRRNRLAPTRSGFPPSPPQRLPPRRHAADATAALARPAIAPGLYFATHFTLARNTGPRSTGSRRSRRRSTPARSSSPPSGGSTRTSSTSRSRTTTPCSRS